MSSAIEVVPNNQRQMPSVGSLAAADRRDLSSRDREELSRPPLDIDLPAGVAAALSLIDPGVVHAAGQRVERFQSVQCDLRDLYNGLILRTWSSSVAPGSS
jgi:hypothetical protein